MLVDAFDKSLFYGDTNQGGDEALGYRSDQVLIVLTESVVIAFLAFSHDEKCIDATESGIDFSSDVKHQTRFPGTADASHNNQLIFWIADVIVLQVMDASAFDLNEIHPAPEHTLISFLSRYIIQITEMELKK